MFFLFGWGHRTTNDEGEAVPVHCHNCNNDVYWHLVHTKTWFTLFFAPVFPYESDHWLMCPVCKAGRALHGSDEVRSAQALVAATFSFKQESLTEDAYMAQINATGLA